MNLVKVLLCAMNVHIVHIVPGNVRDLMWLETPLSPHISL